MTETRWIISYDISSPRRLYRVAKTLSAVGTRKQWSVFECWLTPWMFAQLRRDISRMIEAAEDSVRFYPLTGTARRINAAEPDGYYIV